MVSITLDALGNLMSSQLTLEWSRLSKYTGNDTYRKLAEGSVLTIAKNVCILLHP